MFFANVVICLFICLFTAKEEAPAEGEQKTEETPAEDATGM